MIAILSLFEVKGNRMKVLKCKLVGISMIWVITSILVYSLPSKMPSVEEANSAKPVVVSAVSLVKAPSHVH